MFHEFKKKLIKTRIFGCWRHRGAHAVPRLKPPPRKAQLIWFHYSSNGFSGYKHLLDSLQNGH